MKKAVRTNNIVLHLMTPQGKRAKLACYNFTQNKTGITAFVVDGEIVTNRKFKFKEGWKFAGIRDVPRNVADPDPLPPMETRRKLSKKKTPTDEFLANKETREAASKDFRSVGGRAFDSSVTAEFLRQEAKRQEEFSKARNMFGSVLSGKLTSGFVPDG